MKKSLFILFTTFFLIIGCSDGEDKTAAKQPDKEHILKDQVRALKKAEAVGQALQNANDKRQYRDINEGTTYENGQTSKP